MMNEINKHKVLMILIFLGVFLGNGRIGYQTAFAVADGVDVINYSIGSSSQSIDFRDGGGNDIGTGSFWVNVNGDTNGHIKGWAEINMDALIIELTFPSLDTLIYENHLPVGVVLNGRGIATIDGQTKTFSAPVKVRFDTTSTLPDRIIWDISEEPVVIPNGLNFDFQGTLQFWEQ